MKAIIHIGGEKIGTSTIQAFCATNRAILEEQGIKHYAGAGPVVSGADAKSFYRKFATSNRAVKARYFPGVDRPLFDEDFTH